MKKHVRAVVAYVAGRLVTGNESSYVYDYSVGRYRSVSGSVRPDQVNVYDYEERCYLGGNGSSTALSLYHYGEQSHISIQISGDSFSGYDYGAQHHFSGNVNGSSVDLYDYGESGYFSYST